MFGKEKISLFRFYTLFLRGTLLKDFYASSPVQSSFYGLACVIRMGYVLFYLHWQLRKESEREVKCLVQYPRASKRTQTCNIQDRVLKPCVL